MLPDKARASAPTSVRRAVPSDSRDIATIGVLGWQAAYRGILPQAFLDRLSIEARTRAWHAAMTADEQADVPAWIAEREDVAVGFVSTGPPRDDDIPRDGAEVYAIYVLPTAWRSGVGAVLLRTATEYWLDRGAAPLVLWVLEANVAARAFYERLGWRPDGSRQPIVLGETVFEVRYRLSRAGG